MPSGSVRRSRGSTGSCRPDVPFAVIGCKIVSFARVITSRPVRSFFISCLNSISAGTVTADPKDGAPVRELPVHGSIVMSSGRAAVADYAVATAAAIVSLRAIV